MELERAYYSHYLDKFVADDEHSIFGEIIQNDQSSAGDLQRNAWEEQIRVLKHALAPLKGGYLLFEYTIPRIGKRIDNVFIYQGVVFLLEFKVGTTEYARDAIDQVIDYALDLHDFHEDSHHAVLAPILICTGAPNTADSVPQHPVLNDNIVEVYRSNGGDLSEYIKRVASIYGGDHIDPKKWMNSAYKPTPTIIEAARVLYNGHRVEDISRSDANAKNLNQTSAAINRIVDSSKRLKRKSICFITGVPGAGKTLAGLNIAIQRQRVDENEHAVFLSGNGPLVAVLQEALARDDKARNGVKKDEAMRKAKEFIQLIHHFRDDALSTDRAPVEKVVIFDEAQRAWDQPKLTKFMKEKKNRSNFDMSEPEFLISILDRHTDWATIICLVGGGQEINTGESAGIAGWFDSIRHLYRDWDVYISDKITDAEYSRGRPIEELTAGIRCNIEKDLHLGVSLRSYRSEKVSTFVKNLLDLDTENANMLYQEFADKFPIVMTRDLSKARLWVRSKAKGSQRYGMIASSGGARLRKDGVWVKNTIKPPVWFLNGKDDVRSSYYMEEVATEFDIQGLELDWTVVCWDANLRMTDGEFSYHNFRGTKWEKVNNLDNVLYLKNSYRVLLTRARQGMVIFVPTGSEDDPTAPPEYYDGIYNYLREIGIEEI